MWGLKVALALLAGAPVTPPIATVDTFLKDVPGVSSQPTAPTITKVDGIQVVQRMVRSDRSPEELRTFFGAAFDKAGLYIAPEQDEMAAQVGVQISGLDTENLMSYTALLQPSGTKGTTIVMAVANLGHKDVPESIGPVYPGGNSITSYNFEGVKAMTYKATGTPAEIKAFYRDTLGSAGYKETDPNTYVKGNQQFVVSVSPGVSERQVLLRLEAAGATPPPGSLDKMMPATMPTEVPKVKRPKLP